MNIPFDIKYRPQIESDNYKIKTSEGYPVRIICWDMIGDNPIVGLVTVNGEENCTLFDINGKNILNTCNCLFITIAMTDLEACMLRYLQEAANANDDNEILAITANHSDKIYDCIFDHFPKWSIADKDLAITSGVIEDKVTGEYHFGCLLSVKRGERFIYYADLKKLLGELKNGDDVR